MPAWAEAATYYVKQASTNTTTCALATSSTGNNPVNTFKRGLECMAGGDTLQLMADGLGGTATYEEDLYSTNTNPPSGTAGAHTTIRTFGTDTIRFTHNSSLNFYNGNFEYVDFIGGCTTGINRVCKMIWDGGANGANFAIAGGNIAFGGTPNTPAHHLIFDGIRVTGYWNNNGISGEASNVTIRNSRIDNNGIDYSSSGFPGYGFYIAAASGFVLEFSEIDNNGNWGVHHFSSGLDYTCCTGAVLRFNIFRNNGVTKPAAQSSGDVLMGMSNNAKIYGNLVYGSGSEYGIRIDYTSRDALVYNNTVHGSTYAAYGQGDAAGTPPQNNTFINNIAHPTGVGTAFSLGTSTGSVFSNNLCSSSTTGCDPLLSESPSTTFNDVASNNFTLKAGSKAINGGTDLPSPYNKSIDGTTRNPGFFDVGAYETTMMAPSCPAASPALVASYSFEGVGTDGTGNGHTATLGTGWSYTTGKFAQGAVTDGTAGITVADANDLDFCGGFTLMAWVNLPDTLNDYALIVKNPNSKYFLFASISNYCGAGRMMGGYSQDPTFVAACYSSAPITTGIFQHLAVTYDSTFPTSSVKLYINGSQIASADGTALLDATTGTLQFCESGFGEICPSGTILDDVKIFNYALTSPQIITAMGGAARTVKVATGQTVKVGQQ